VDPKVTVNGVVQRRNVNKKETQEYGLSHTAYSYLNGHFKLIS